ncbi:MAG: UDP-2,4-diacetamido-2,4,6-trideoxy-beta-L-altropyranose hydrolase, partial [Campylobacterota bacterium]|nr:UDP-2,4-diacetamido-2,4,6-trideoxy-beta-L-altropyranose hydrolase [Campylobacterota bacterium]
MSNKTKNILFRADSSSLIGTGHIMRDLVLAKQYLKADITFATQELDGHINHKIIEFGYELKKLKSNDIKELDKLIKKLSIDMIVIDHYGIDYSFEKKLKEKNPNLIILCLDDTYEKHHCDILLNHNIYANTSKYKNLVPKYCELRCGSQYTLLREEFLKEKEITRKLSKNINIFVAMGGTDVANINTKVLKVLAKFNNIEVNIVTTNANENLDTLKKYIKNKVWIKLHIDSTKIAKLMGKSDFSIVTPSVTLNELFYLKKPFIAIKVAKNQETMYQYIQKKKLPVLNIFDENILLKYVK